MFPDDFNRRSLELILEKKYNEAEVILRQAVESMPEGWQPIELSDGTVLVHAWSDDEFAAYRDWRQSAGDLRDLTWQGPSYSHAWYLLGAIYADHNQLDESLALLAQGIELERDHPDLLCEGGFVLHKVGEVEAALKAYAVAISARPWITPRQRARGLRGSSSILVEQGRFEIAEQRLVEALALEPDNEITAHGLDYVRRQRAKS